MTITYNSRSPGTHSHAHPPHPISLLPRRNCQPATQYTTASCLVRLPTWHQGADESSELNNRRPTARTVFSPRPRQYGRALTGNAPRCADQNCRRPSSSVSVASSAPAHASLAACRRHLTNHPDTLQAVLPYRLATTPCRYRSTALAAADQPLAPPPPPRCPASISHTGNPLEGFIVRHRLRRAVRPVMQPGSQPRRPVVLRGRSQPQAARALAPPQT